MNKFNQNISQKIESFVKQYSEMEINGLIVSCPYWINRLKNGKVTLRGFAKGKGRSSEIREELIKRLSKMPVDLKFELTPETVRKFAKRERIGIDCSGFVYRVLDELLHCGYGDTNFKNLDKVFSGGINKTNVKRLSDLKYSDQIKIIDNFQIGDMIRLWGGKHIAIIIGINKKEILYAHSSWLSTKIQGTHASTILIVDDEKSLDEQVWMEKTRSGENFGKKYFNPDKGDGVFRLKIFT